MVDWFRHCTLNAGRWVQFLLPLPNKRVIKMGVLSCDRYGCENIMCDRYSNEYGYICNECFEELIQSTYSIKYFMNLAKNYNGIETVDRRSALEAVFEDRHETI